MPAPAARPLLTYCHQISQIVDNWLMKKTHGLSKLPEYSVWAGMKARCSNPNNGMYRLYGGRGVRVCEAWKASFPQFLLDMGPRPSPLHSIDRWPDKDGDYEPGNCRWATAAQQAMNKRSNRLVDLAGEKMPMTLAARLLNVNPATLKGRLDRGETVKEAASRPTNHPGRKPSVLIEVNGEMVSLSIAAALTGLPLGTIRKRVQRFGAQATKDVLAPLPSPQNPRGGALYKMGAEEMSLHKWAQKLGVPRSLLRNRLAIGWTFEKAATEPRRR